LTQIEVAFWTELSRVPDFTHVDVLRAEPAFWIELTRVADFTTIISIVVAVLAVILALRQLGLTEAAEEAAERARDEVKREAALRQLMGILPSLEKVKREFEAAVREDERQAVERELAEWCDSGSKVKGMLAGRSDVPPAVVRNLDTSIALASTAMMRLGDPDVDVAPTTERARLAIQRAGAGLADLSGRLETFVEYAAEEEEEQET
jgi:hypothetical protein